MVDIELINQIKRITIISLVQDDDLMETLVLKGGNALSLGYGLSERASYDLDFSMEEDFDEEVAVIQERLGASVKAGFSSYGYVVIDFKITEKPKILREELQLFGAVITWNSNSSNKKFMTCITQTRKASAEMPFR